MRLAKSIPIAVAVASVVTLPTVAYATPVPSSVPAPSTDTRSARPGWVTLDSGDRVLVHETGAAMRIAAIQRQDPTSRSPMLRYTHHGEAYLAPADHVVRLGSALGGGFNLSNLLGRPAQPGPFGGPPPTDPPPDAYRVQTTVVDRLGGHPVPTPDGLNTVFFFNLATAEIDAVGAHGDAVTLQGGQYLVASVIATQEPQEPEPTRTLMVHPGLSVSRDGSVPWTRGPRSVSR